MYEFESADRLILWLESIVNSYDFDVIGLARRYRRPPYPLPTEPGALANILETTAVRQLGERLVHDESRVQITPGTQRRYPDVELFGGLLGDRVVALNVKVARRGQVPKTARAARRTQSRITLLTGNTYFARPDHPHASIMRTYNEYWMHLDWIMLFDIDVSAEMPEVTNIAHVVAETWQLASHQRSSETRNYIGAVTALSDLQAKRGEFRSRDEFETFWRREYVGWRETPGLAERRATYQTATSRRFLDLTTEQESPG